MNIYKYIVDIIFLSSNLRILPKNKIKIFNFSDYFCDLQKTRC